MYLEEDKYRLLRTEAFQAFPGYAEIDRSPAQVAFQTDVVLGLLFRRILNLGPAREYLRDYTVGHYINNAKSGFNDFFSRRHPTKALNGKILPNNYHPSIEEREAIDHMAVVFAHMHDVIMSPYLPTGFSRRGMLGNPETSKEFGLRIIEMESVLGRMVDGSLDLKEDPFLRIPAFRTLSFFRTASILPLHKMTSQKEEDEFQKHLYYLDSEPKTTKERQVEKDEKEMVNETFDDIQM